METTRTTKELLELLLTKKDIFYSGLCALIIDLLCNGTINREERNILRDYIENNPPFNTHTLYAVLGEDYSERNYYYWEVGNFVPREKWIKKQIKKLSK